MNAGLKSWFSVCPTTRMGLWLMAACLGLTLLSGCEANTCKVACARLKNCAQRTNLLFCIEQCEQWDARSDELDKVRNTKQYSEAMDRYLECTATLDISRMSQCDFVWKRNCAANILTEVRAVGKISTVPKKEDRAQSKDQAGASAVPMTRDTAPQETTQP